MRSSVKATSLLILLIALSAASVAQSTFRFEAEEISEPKTAWQKDRYSETKWNLWSTDRDAMRKWSGGVVLQSPRVMKDRKRPEDGAPPLHSVVRDLPPGRYHVFIGKPFRPLAISFDGRKWLRVEGRGYLGTFQIRDGRFEIWVDDRYASLTNPGSTYYDYLEFTPVPDPNRKPKVQGYAKERVKEKLDRGLVALPMDGGRIYIGWRLLAEDPPDIGFNLYRRTEQGVKKLNDRPMTRTTDFVDEHPVPSQRNRYFIRPVIDGKEGPSSKEAWAIPSEKGRNFISIKLQGNYTFQKCGIADLDGDGDYDFVIKQPNFNVDPYVRYWRPSPGTYKIEAYLNDGAFLWRYDLGWAIEQGIWYSPYVVYDLDGDGRAEICLKTGRGDPRDEEGKVRSGPEYLTILDGMTGRVKAQTDWPSREGFLSYNHASRNQMCIAYLDGKTPSLIVERGTYGLIKVVAYQLQDGKLTELWRWSSDEEGPLYRGQGAHSMHAADVDGDGRDEIFLGSAVLDDNGCGLWSTGLGHPDHHYVGDIDPSHPGLEVYYGMETRQAQNGCCLVDAKTGRILWGISWPTRHVHSRGICADIDPDSPGRECYSSDTDAQKRSERRWLFSAQGEILRDDLNWGFGLLTVHWDADPQKELIRGKHIFNYKGKDYGKVFEGKVVAIADVVGDWREELIVSLPGELRIYTTTIPARDRRVCLMQDRLYRMDVVVQSMGYTQSPMTSQPLSTER